MRKKYRTGWQPMTLLHVDDPRAAEILEEMQHPDGADEHLFVALEDDSPALADDLKRRFVEKWLREASLPLHRFDDALETVELRVAPDESEARWRLRLRSFYTGHTYWLYAWDRSREDAGRWIDEMAELQGMNVDRERRHGRTPWDEHRWGTTPDGRPRRRRDVRRSAQRR